MDAEAEVDGYEVLGVGLGLFRDVDDVAAVDAMRRKEREAQRQNIADEHDYPSDWRANATTGPEKWMQEVDDEEKVAMACMNPEELFVHASGVADSGSQEQDQLLVIVQDADDEVKKKKQEKKSVARVRTNSGTDLPLTMMQVAKDVAVMQKQTKKKEKGKTPAPRDKEKGNQAVQKTRQKQKVEAAAAKDQRKHLITTSDKLILQIRALEVKQKVERGNAFEVKKFVKAAYPAEFARRGSGSRTRKRERARTEEERKLREQEVNRGSSHRNSLRKKFDGQQLSEEIDFLDQENERMKDHLNALRFKNAK